MSCSTIPYTHAKQVYLLDESSQICTSASLELSLAVLTSISPLIHALRVIESSSECRSSSPGADRLFQAYSKAYKVGNSLESVDEEGYSHCQSFGTFDN